MEAQLLRETFAHALNLSAFDEHYRKDEQGAPACALDVSSAGVFTDNSGRNNRSALRQHVKPLLQRARGVCGNANAAQCCCALRPWKSLKDWLGPL